MLKTILTVILSTFMLSANAQTGRIFDTDNRLSSNFVCQVMQDRHGFIWVATQNGLNRYDGYNFSVIRSSDVGSRGFFNNYVNCMVQDQEGNIYLGTNNSLVRYNGLKYEKVPMMLGGQDVKSYIHHLMVRRNGQVMACTSGYGIVCVDKGQSQGTSIKGKLSTYKYVFHLSEDHLGRLWATMENGELVRLETNGRITYDLPGLDGCQVVETIEDRKGNVYAATLRQGLYVMKTGSGRFVHVDGTSNLHIQCLCVGRHGGVLMGCNGEGICHYDPVTDQVKDNPFFCNRFNLRKTKVNSIIEDREGNVWIGMLQKGVFMQPLRTYDFGYMGFRLGERNMIGENSVTSVLRSRDGFVWVGTDKDGLYRMNYGTKGPIGANHVVKQPLAILNLCEDRQGNIWLGTYQDGCGYVDAAGNYHLVELGLGRDISVFDIKADDKGNMWMATMGKGLLCRRPDGTVRQYVRQPKADSDRRINSIPNDYLLKLAFSPNYDRLYVATSVGLACLDLKTGSWLSAFKSNCICMGSFSHCVFVDRNGNVWYGTETGAYCFDKDGREIHHYDTGNGLSDNSIAFLTEDARGDIWIGTKHGLCRLHVATGKVNCYFVESGLQSNEFSDGAAFAADKGRLLLFGGTGGVNWIDPMKLKQHTWKPSVCLSQLMVGNRIVHAGDESGNYVITEQRVIDSRRFNLAHDDNSFALHFSTVTYNNVEQIAYAYSINGDDWHQMQPGVNELTFSHLAAGNYHFRVKAVSNQQETDVYEFDIRIHPAWYASIWAKLIYLALLALAVWVYIQHRRKLETDRMLLQQHIHAEEMGEAKLRFFMNISHEIRTPMTLIVTPLLSLIKDDKDPRRQPIYETIRRNAERILHLINQMMDLRKIDKGQMVMHMSKNDLIAFVRDEYQLFQQQAATKNIQFRYEHDCDKLPIWIDRNNFDKVIMNVLSNAFKFTPAGGTILIHVTHTEHHAYISIKDTGMGIPKDKLESIFQRFYQSPTTPSDRNIGTGIGLDLTRSLVELHYGTIIARNNEDVKNSGFSQGSEFLIRLPLGNEHLKPEEMATEEEVEQEELQIGSELKEQAEEPEEGTDAGNGDVETGKKSKTKASIALVEDDEEILTFLQNQFADDYNVYTYHDGKEAFLDIVRNQPDLIVSDIMMPEMDGTTLCSKVKANVNTNHIPVILLTAKSREEDQLEGLATGADAYILKPFNMDILRRTVVNLLNVRRTLRNKFNGNESQEARVEKVAMQAPDEVLMERVMQMINENLSDSDLSVDMIAQKVGISRVHLHRKMKELTNQTPHCFVRNIRLKQAAEMLRTSKRNITEVMYLCGFTNAASFSTMFKNLYGCSPREYMNGEK